jgi:hypothetical protein
MQLASEFFSKVATSLRKGFHLQPTVMALAMPETLMIQAPKQCLSKEPLDLGDESLESRSRQSSDGLEAAATPVGIDESRYESDPSIYCC